MLTGALLASKSGGSGALLLAGPAGGGVVYFALFRFYRNTDKTHSFERETRVAAQPITGSDRKFDEIKGTKKSHTDGANQSNHRTRVQRVS
jgi:hypothetical protein